MTALRSTNCRCAVAGVGAAGAGAAGVGAAGGGDPPGAAGVAVVAGGGVVAVVVAVAGVVAGGVVVAGEVGGPSNGSPSCRWCDAWCEEEDQRVVRAVMGSFRAEETSGKE